jgi:plastocyanin
MRKHLISALCLGGLSMIGLWLWERPVRAAGDIKTVEIVRGPAGPVLSPEPVEINKGQSIEWVPKKAELKHQLLEDVTNKKITEVFNENGPDPETVTKKFPNTDFPNGDGDLVIKYHCRIHPNTMHGTITVK